EDSPIPSLSNNNNHNDTNTTNSNKNNNNNDKDNYNNTNNTNTNNSNMQSMQSPDQEEQESAKELQRRQLQQYQEELQTAAAATEELAAARRPEALESSSLGLLAEEALKHAREALAAAPPSLEAAAGAAEVIDTNWEPPAPAPTEPMWSVPPPELSESLWQQTAPPPPAPEQQHQQRQQRQQQQQAAEAAKHGALAGAAAPSEELLPDLSGLTWKELSALCRMHMLQPSGRKAELLARLRRWEKKQAKQQAGQKEPPAEPVEHERPEQAEQAEQAEQEQGEEEAEAAEQEEAQKGTAVAGVASWTATASHCESSQRAGDLSALPLRELRIACADLELPSHGSKQDILARLAMYAESQMTPHMTQMSQQYLNIEASLPRACEAKSAIALPSESLDAPESLVPVSSGQEPTTSGFQESCGPEAPKKEQENKEELEPEPTRRTRRSSKQENKENKKEQEELEPEGPPAVAGRLGPEATGSLVRDLSGLSLRELRKACQEHKLPSGGSKAALIERLAELVASQPDASVASSEVPEAATSPPEPAATLWVPPTRSPLREGQGLIAAARAKDNDKDPVPIEATVASEAASASESAKSPEADALSLIAAVTRDLSALPLRDLREACRSRGLPAH
ncbi:unnamed protein product, partial [Polarella glacialis]